MFTHTVLEQIYDVHTAVSNLCKITKDIVITVVPFIQAFHHRAEFYHDYWRFTPYSIYELFKEQGLKTIYLNWNNDPFGNIYLFHIASKDKTKWQEDFKGYLNKGWVPGPGHTRQMLLSNIRRGGISDVRLNREEILDL